MSVEVEDETGENTLIRWELPLQKIIPKKIYEAQQSPQAMMSDDLLMREAMPDSLDWRLRIRYSSLLQQYLDPMRPMRGAILLEDIYRDICSYEVFKRRIDIPAKAVFISRRIGSFTEDQDALLTAFSGRMWEIASAPMTKKDGSLDIEAVKLIHKTMQLLLDRKFGQAVQRQVTAVMGTQTLDPIAIEAQIRELEAVSDKQRR